MKGQKRLRRWEIAQEAERESWENFKSLKSDSTKRQLGEYWSWYLDLIGKHISFRPEWKILDVGCGPAGIINYIPVGRRFGLDPLMDFYLSNFELPYDIEWKAGTMEHIPFDTDYFDVVITTNTLDHALDPRKGLKEMYRVIRTGGFLVLTVDCYAPIHRLLRIIREKVGKGDKPHPYNFSRRQIEAMIREAGFTLLASHKGRGTMGVWFYETSPTGRFNMVDKAANLIFWLENRIFGYSRVDFVFIAQKS